MGAEGSLFSLSYTALSTLNLKDELPELKPKFEGLVQLLVRKAQQESLANSFGESHFDSRITSVLYAGHLNFIYLVANEFDILSDIDQRKFKRLNTDLFKSFQQSDFGVLPSYDFGIWIPDNVAALASLKLSAIQTKNVHREKEIDKLFERLCNNYVHKELQLPFSTVNIENGKPQEVPRGSMLGWSIMFTNYLSPEVSKNWYASYKEHFSRNRLILTLFKEWPKSNNSQDDIDSGPTLLGYSIPANAFALGGAILHSDHKTATRTHRLMNLGRKKVSENSILKFETRLIDLNASPMMEALSLYIETLNI